jgi:hypothetical protein
VFLSPGSELPIFIHVFAHIHHGAFFALWSRLELDGEAKGIAHGYPENDTS